MARTLPGLGERHPLDLCFCPGVTWALRNVYTTKPCPSCGESRNDDRCVLCHEVGCRSSDRAHIEALHRGLHGEDSGLDDLPAAEPQPSADRKDRHRP